MEPVSVALAVAKLAVPYLLKLKEKTEEAAGKKVGELVLEGALQTGKKVWDTLGQWYHGDEDFLSIAKLMESKPADETRRDLLAGELAVRLEKDPHKGEELQRMIGGQSALNTILAGEESKLARISQKIKGKGTNSLTTGKKSEVTDLVQEIEN